MTDVSKMLDMAAGSEDEMIGFVQSLIRLQPQGEPAIQTAVGERLASLGARVEHMTYSPTDVPVIKEFAASAGNPGEDRDSVLGIFPAAAAGGRSVILFAHPDGEPLEAEPGWDRDPFSGEIANGKIYGWGVADDLAGVAIMTEAMALIEKAGIKLAGEVIVASTPSKRHARGVAAVMHNGYVADGAIYLHPAESGVGMQEIKAIASGQLEFTVTITGKAPETTEPGKTSFAHLGVSPLDKMMPVIAALKALDAERGARVHHPLLDAEVGRSTNIHLSSVQFGTGSAFSRFHETLELGGAISFPPGESIEAVQAEIIAAIDKAAAGDEWLSAHPPVIDWRSGVTGAEVQASHDLFATAAAAIREVCGVDPHVNPMHTSSDIRNPMVQKDIPTIGLGPLCGDLTQTGRRNEWVDRDDYVRAVKVTAASIVGWCGTA
ncbi:M20 family metallopeptidase [Devosia sp.]|uniref:M20 family metallopeptidase n=1 Tax=Devosia sp. TaxID=1871048 RepID=UPI003A954991